MAAHEKGVGECAEGSEGEGVLDFVEDASAGETVLGLGGDAVAVVPGGEGAGELSVAEVGVPLEFVDLGEPSLAERDAGEEAEAYEHFRADTGGGALEAEGGVFGEGSRRGRDEAGALDAGALPGWHEVRQVGGIGKKGENQLNRVGYPLRCDKGFRHGLTPLSEYPNRALQGWVRTGVGRCVGIRVNRAASGNVRAFRQQERERVCSGVRAFLVDRGARVQASTKKRRNRWLELIAAYKLLQSLLLAAVGVGALRLVGQDLGDLLTNLAQEIRVNTEGRLVSFLLEQASLVDDHMLRRFSIFVFCYAVVGLVEGVGLMLEKRWAEYLTAIITGSFLPLEILELMRRVTTFRVGLFAVNLAVLIYLVLHLHAGLKGNRAEAGEDTADNENVDSSR